MTETAQGSFTVQMTPMAEPATQEGVALGRFELRKAFDGDLQGTGQGEMLTAVTPVKGSAGYTAIERVEGTLNGRQGSFVLQHSGTMTRGAQQLSITIVPDSGTGGLAGIAGVFHLTLSEGQHLYRIDYSLTPTPAK